MYKKLAVILLSLLLLIGAIPGGVQAADITDASVSDATIDATSGSVTMDHPIDVTNNGNATTSDFTITDTPSGVSVSGENGERIRKEDTTTLNLEINADESSESGEVEGDVNGEPFSFYLTVETPPQPGLSSEPFDAGDVVNDRTSSGDLTIEEVSGTGSQDDVEYDIVDSPSDASISFPSGLNYGTSEWEITVSDAEQYDTLTWTLELWDTGDRNVAREVDIEARVIYPGYIESASLADSSVTFDQPKASTSSIDKDITVDVTNGGDLPLDISEIEASASNSDIDVAGAQGSSISGGSSEEVDLEATLQTSLGEGNYDISGTVFASDSSDEDFSGEIDVTHGTELSGSDISFGDIPVGQSGSSTTTIEEELGYKGVENVELEKQSGPNNWLSISGTPDSIDSGGQTEASFTVEFDSTANLGNEYEWRYDIEGEATTADSIIVTATPIPLDMEPIQNSLSGYNSQVASSTLDVVEQMDQEIRSGTAPRDQISNTLAFADSAEIYIQSINNASSSISNGEHAAAQASLMRAASAYNTMDLYSQEFSSSQLGSLSQQVTSQANGELQPLLTEQQQHYEAQINSGELTYLEESRINRQLAQIERFNGNTQRATELEAEAESSFSNYVETVSQAESDIQDGEQSWTQIQRDSITIFGQPLLLNPIKYTTYNNLINDVRSSYESGIDKLVQAGAESRISTAQSTYDSKSLGLAFAQGSLIISLLAYILTSVGVIFRTARQTYRYIEDTQTVTSGDFLLE